MTNWENCFYFQIANEKYIEASALVSNRSDKKLRYPKSGCFTLHQIYPLKATKLMI